jgi:F-type H+-transporting ATPase subunit delta
MPNIVTTPRRFSRLPSYDPSAWRVAVVYAQALIGAAESRGQTELVREEFDSLARDVLDALPNLEGVLASGFVEVEHKLAMLEKALGGRASPIFLNFLKVVARHERLDLLRLIHVAFGQEYDRLRGRVHVLVASADPIDANTEQRIAREIRTRMNLEPVLDKQVHPELIGGVVIRVGDRVFDGSVATQLARLREKMLHRSVHEIQSRRDRFRSAEGN